MRQAGSHSFTLRSSESVRALATRATRVRTVCGAAASVVVRRNCEPVNEDDRVGNRFEVRAFPVPGRLPGYAGRAPVEDAVFAYAIRDRRSGGRLLFAPVYEAIDDVLLAAIAQADVALLDGSFYADDEMRAAGSWTRVREISDICQWEIGRDFDRLEGFELA